MNIRYNLALQAVRRRDLDSLRNINDLSQELIEQSLFIAAEKGYFEIFKYLAEKADEEETEWSDYQVNSAEKGYVNIFAYLNEHYKDYVYDDWNSFVEDAVIRGDFEMVKYLDQGNMDQYVILAMEHKQHRIAKYALEYGNVRFMDYEEYLREALEQGYLDLVEIIAEQLEDLKDIDWNQIYEEFEGDCSDVVCAYIKNKIKEK